MLVELQNLTSIILKQQQLCDNIYQEAIEANYSHEQMTPLNSILGCSHVLLESFQMSNEQQPTTEKLQKLVKDSMRMLRCVHQSGSGMYLYNMNQIMRMKLEKKEVQVSTSECITPLQHVELVIYPFVSQILANKIRVLVSDQTQMDNVSFVADWKLYELILFNIIQNAVKYNSYLGVILVVLKVIPGRRNRLRRFLQTDIIDTGSGIDPARQSFLFKPFLELKQLQCFEKVKDRTIGLGLSCSSEISRALGGKLELIQSQPELTVMRVSIPIRTRNSSQKQQVVLANRTS